MINDFSLSFVDVSLRDYGLIYSYFGDGFVPLVLTPCRILSLHIYFHHFALQDYICGLSLTFSLCTLFIL